MTAGNPPITFIVNSGRCGSTALSGVLRSHPRVLSLSEFFRMLGIRAVAPGQCDGREFWRLLSEPRPHITAMLRYRVEPAEIIYPVDGPGCFNRASGIPAVSAVALPHLTSDPDRLLDELHEYAVRLPVQTRPDHFRSLFAWLCTRFGRDIVVERSGGSLHMIRDLRRAFPEARFIHLYRDGRRVAVSMSGHTGFRLWVLAQDADRSVHPETIIDDLGERVLSREPPGEQELATMTTAERTGKLLCAMRFPVHQLRLPVWRFGVLWTAMVSLGTAELAALGASRLLSVDFDDLLTEPASQLARIDRFLQVPTASCGSRWPLLAAELLRPDAKDWRAGLTDVERRRLEIACRPGMKLLYGGAS